MDYVPPALPQTGRSKLLILEDNEPVIKMTIKGRSPNMKHVGRVHRINLDLLFECFQEDPEISIRWVDTKQQVADFRTKGQFTAEQWSALMRLSQTGKPHALLSAPAVNRSNCCGISHYDAGGYSSHVERSTRQEKSEDLPSVFRYHSVRRPRVIGLVTIPRVRQEHSVTIPWVKQERSVTFPG